MKTTSQVPASDDPAIDSDILALERLLWSRTAFMLAIEKESESADFGNEQL